MCTAKAASVTLNARWSDVCVQSKQPQSHENARRSDVCVQSKQPQSHEILGGVMYVYSQRSLSHHMKY